MQGYIPGSPSQTVTGEEIEITMIREVSELFGTSALQTVNLGHAAVNLPLGVLSSLRNTSQQPGIVDFAIIRFFFNIRQIAHAPNQPPGFNSSNITVPGAIANNFTIKEVTSLYFLDSNNPTELFDPYNLSTRINITIPLQSGFSFINDSNITTTVCGSYDDYFLGWSVEGCYISSYTNSTVVCSCTHASDFAAWEAFVDYLGGGEIGIIVTIAIVVVGILFPAIVVLYIVGMFWAIRRDRLDAHGVHIGAVLILTKNRLRMRAKQRKFFDLLRENAKSPQPLLVDTRKTLELAKQKQQALLEIQMKTKSKDRCRRIPMILRRWFNAIMYEHSLFGVYLRFDPYYTRAQRFTVVVAVLCGNIFISAFAYDLKFAPNVTYGFIIAVAIVSSLIISLPVKMIVRVLFRETEAELGSYMDRVTQIYRVSQINQDLLPIYTSDAEKADIEMLLAFRQFYILKADLQHLQKLLDEKTERPGPMKYYLNRCLKSRNKATSKESKQRRHQSIAIRLGIENMETADETTLRKNIDILKKSIQKAKFELKTACESARIEWSKVPRRNNIRVETLRKQQSTIMKFASLLYDEADAGPPRERRKIFRSTFLYIAWFLVFAYLIGTLGFTIRWLLAITSIKTNGTQDPNALNPNDTIIAWIVSSFVGVGTSFLFTEPLIQFVRFSLIPACLVHCGSGIVSNLQPHYNQVQPEVLEVQVDEKDIEDKKHPHLLQIVHSPEIIGPSIRTKANFQDEFLKQQRKRKEGEDVALSTVFDTLSEIVQSIV